jgi:hypothetical protein
MGEAGIEATLSFPFFSLEYGNGVFLRRLPKNAKDLGGGIFRYEGKDWKLPEGEAALCLAGETISGRALLSLLRDSAASLIDNGPRLALEGERLTELSGCMEDSLSLRVELRKRHTDIPWLFVDGLAHHRLCGNVIYEVIDEATLAATLAEFDGGAVAKNGEVKVFLLKGENIPRFADRCARPVFLFADKNLKELLAEDSIFIGTDKISLVLGAVQSETGLPYALPLLRVRDRFFHAQEVSSRMDRDYLLFGSRWVRRKDIEAAGILPFCSFAGGEPIGKIRLKPEEFLLGGGKRLEGLFTGFFADTSLWIEKGKSEEIFVSHLEFLRTWGIPGGVAHNNRSEQAAYLAAWLKNIAANSARNDAQKILVLMEKNYYELYMIRHRHEFEAAFPESIVFYEELSAVTRRTGVLVLVGVEEVLVNEQIMAKIQGINAGTILGVFYDAGELFKGPAAARTRSLFGITAQPLATGGEQTFSITPFLIRNTGSRFSLPQYKFSPPDICRPPGLYSATPREIPQEVFTFTVNERFSNLAAAGLYSEMHLLRAEGKPFPFVPLRLLKGSLNPERMDEDERAFYLYWRSEFRKGNILKTSEDYIRIYARELCLFSESEDRVGNFLMLKALLECYSPIYGGINEFLPNWLLDYAVIYEMADILPLLAKFAGDACTEGGNAVNAVNVVNVVNALLADICIYFRLIKENNRIDFNDVRMLIPGEIAKSPFFRAENLNRFSHERAELAADITTAINAVDSYLRETFRIKLMEFFYPRRFQTERLEAFAGMERSGNSSYEASGPRFSKNPWLVSFLKSLFKYVEQCYKTRKKFDIKNRQGIAPHWKTIIDRALEGGLIPADADEPFTKNHKPQYAVPAFNMPRRVRLLETGIEKTRADSDAVRDMLTIEGPNIAHDKNLPQGGIKGFTKPVFEKTSDNITAQFIKKLDTICLGALKIITEGLNAKNSLTALALANNTMPDLLIDKINAVFHELSGDLLISIVDSRPEIQSEYRKELANYLEKT